MVGVAIEDPREFQIPDIGIVELEDAETGEGVLVDFGDPYVRDHFSKLTLDAAEKRTQLFRRIGMDAVRINTQDDYADPLMRFFRTRARKIRA